MAVLPTSPAQAQALNLPAPCRGSLPQEPAGRPAGAAAGHERILVLARVLGRLAAQDLAGRQRGRLSGFGLAVLVALAPAAAMLAGRLR